MQISCSFSHIFLTIRIFITSIFFIFLHFSVSPILGIKTAGAEELENAPGIFDTDFQQFIQEIEKYRDPFVPLIGKKKANFRAIEGNLKLEGILWSSVNPLVVINNEILGLGDEIDGAIVERIDRDRVVLRYNNRTFSLVFWEQGGVKSEKR